MQKVHTHFMSFYLINELIFPPKTRSYSVAQAGLELNILRIIRIRGEHHRPSLCHFIQGLEYLLILVWKRGGALLHSPSGYQLLTPTVQRAWMLNCQEAPARKFWRMLLTSLQTTLPLLHHPGNKGRHVTHGTSHIIPSGPNCASHKGFTKTYFKT